MSSLPVDINAAITNEIVRTNSSTSATEADDSFAEQLRDTEPLPDSRNDVVAAEAAPDENSESNAEVDSLDEVVPTDSDGQADREELLQDDDVDEATGVAINEALESVIADEPVTESPVILGQEDTTEQPVQEVVAEEEQSQELHAHGPKNGDVELKSQVPTELHGDHDSPEQDQPVNHSQETPLPSESKNETPKDAPRVTLSESPITLDESAEDDDVVGGERPQAAAEPPNHTQEIADSKYPISSPTAEDQNEETPDQLTIRPEPKKTEQPMTTTDVPSQQHVVTNVSSEAKAPAVVDSPSEEVTDLHSERGSDTTEAVKSPNSLRDQIGKPLGREEETSGLNRAQNTRFVNRVARAFESAQLRDEPVRIRLSPPELGSMRIEIKVESGGLIARVETETPGARNAIMDNIGVLKDRLSEQGMKIEQFDVDVTDRQPESDQPDEDRRRHRSKGTNEDANEMLHDGEGAERDEEGDGNLNLVA